jgi:DNA invertase Pin-like site-specific DNA recombinase
MLERQREGIAKAKAAGKYKGRKPTAKVKTPEIKRLMAAGIGPTAIARQLGISRASVYRFSLPRHSSTQTQQGPSEGPFLLGD